MESSKDPPLPKPSASDPASFVYGFPVNPPPPAPCAPPVFMDRAPSRGNCGSSVSTCPEAAGCVRTATQAVKLLCSSDTFLTLLIIVPVIGFILYLMIVSLLHPSSVRLSLSGMYISSFDVSPSSRLLNGTWHIDFSLQYYRYDPLMDNHISYGGAAVSVYYKGAYLAGTDLHAFEVSAKHPIRLKVNTDPSRSEVPGWLADGLMEDRRLGIAEFEVQFAAKYLERNYTFLCRGLKLGFSTTEEANLLGDGNIRCPLVA